MDEHTIESLINAQEEKIAAIEIRLLRIIEIEVDRRIGDYKAKQAQLIRDIQLGNKQATQELVLDSPLNHENILLDDYELIPASDINCFPASIAQWNKGVFSVRRNGNEMILVNKNKIVARLFSLRLGRESQYLAQIMTKDDCLLDKIKYYLNYNITRVYRARLVVSSEQKGFMVSNTKYMKLTKNGSVYVPGVIGMIEENIKQIKYDYYVYSVGNYSKCLNILSNCCLEECVFFSHNKDHVVISKNNSSIEITGINSHELLLTPVNNTNAILDPILIDTLDTMLCVYNSFNCINREVPNKVSVTFRMPLKDIHENEFRVSILAGVYVVCIHGDKYVKCYDNLNLVVKILDGKVWNSRTGTWD